MGALLQNKLLLKLCTLWPFSRLKKFFWIILFIFGSVWAQSSLLLGLLSSWGGLGWCTGSVIVIPRLQSLGSVVVAQRLSCPEACGIFLDHLPHWEANALPLNHQGIFIKYFNSKAKRRNFSSGPSLSLPSANSWCSLRLDFQDNSKNFLFFKSCSVGLPIKLFVFKLFLDL